VKMEIKIVEIVEREFEDLVQIPFENGVQRFVDYLDNQGFDIASDLKIEIIEYVYHLIDSKPIGNELGIEIALKYVFMNQLDIEKDSRCTFEELKQ